MRKEVGRELYTRDIRHIYVSFIVNLAFYGTYISGMWNKSELHACTWI